MKINCDIVSKNDYESTIMRDTTKHFKSKILYSCLSKTDLYVHYVDEESTVKMLNYLNNKHLTIQFEMELPGTEGFLSILDIKM